MLQQRGLCIMDSHRCQSVYDKIFTLDNTPSQFRKRLQQFVNMWDRQPEETQIEYRLTNHALWDTKCRSEQRRPYRSY